MSIAVRVIVSTALLGVLAFQVESGQAFAALRSADWLWLAFSFVAFNTSMVIASWRWQSIVISASRRSPRIRFRTSVAATYASLWLSNFLPTAFGGDVVRLAVARRAGVRWAVAVASALADRYLGLLTAVVLFLGSEVLLWSMERTTGLLALAALLAAGLACPLLVLWFGVHARVPRRWLQPAWIRFVVSSLKASRGLLRANRLTLRVAIGSFAATACGVAAYWGAANCVAQGVSVPAALAAATLGTLVSALPISLSGWGIREGTVAAVLSLVGGLTASDASVVAFVNGSVIAMTSLLGLTVSFHLGRGPGTSITQSDRLRIIRNQTTRERRRSA